MNISKRTFLTTGAAAVVSSAFAIPALAAGKEGFTPVAGAALATSGPLALGLGAIIAVGAIAGGGGGGKVNVQDLSVTAINKAAPEDRPTLLGKELETRLSKEFPEFKFNGEIVTAVRKAYGKGLSEGKTLITAAGKEQDWSIKVTIVIKI
ncbi:hypothetical protein [Celeribacter halophilus]|uniref:hypothetical protein n=1 Tax=Celeribacter halophilus TaxID=576117 RepID=UPI003A955076